MSQTLAPTMKMVRFEPLGLILIGLAIFFFGAAAAARFDLSDWRIVHRPGRIKTGGQIMMVATAARHRRAAFDAADYLMDWLKSRAPFWKREIAQDGRATWVEARSDDEDALGRW